MTRYVFLCGVLLLSYYAAAQQRLTGKVVEATTGQAVAYASISVLNTRTGTTSNADGEFELVVPTLPARLVVSDVRYVRDTVAVASGQPLQIRLRPASVMLPEVQPGSYAPELIKKAYRQLRRQYAQKEYGRAFYRQITSLDGDATEVQEMIWDTKSSNAGLEGTALTQARYAEKKALVSFKNFSSYTKSLSIFTAQADTTTSTSIVSPNVARNYALSLVGVTQNGPQQLVEISFVSKPDTPRHYQGSLVIDAATYQILRFRVETPDTKLKSNNPAFSFKDSRTSFELVFRPGPGGSLLDYVKVSYAGALGRPFKDDMKIQASSFTYLYEQQPTPASGVSYLPPGGQADLAAIKRTTYDAAFWQNSSVVKRTPLEEEVIRSFEQKGAFGTLLH